MPKRKRFRALRLVFVLILATVCVTAVKSILSPQGVGTEKRFDARDEHRAPLEKPTTTPSAERTQATQDGDTSEAERTPDWTTATIYAGFPLPISPTEVRVLVNEGFVVGYSEERRNPLWVAYLVFAVQEGVSHPRPSRFRVDGRTQARVSHEDYTHSGYDRGHMAPNHAISTRYGREAQLATFLMSNIAPQTPALNRQLWRRLEMRIANDYAQRFEEVWIITGPVFDDQVEMLASGVEIPDAFYKIILDEDEAGPRVLAFVMPQGAVGGEELGRYLTTVDRIEELTGLDFLSELEDEVEDALESTAAKAPW